MFSKFSSFQVYKFSGFQVFQVFQNSPGSQLLSDILTFFSLGHPTPRLCEQGEQLPLLVALDTIRTKKKGERFSERAYVHRLQIQLKSHF